MRRRELGRGLEARSSGVESAHMGDRWNAGFMGEVKTKMTIIPVVESVTDKPTGIGHEDKTNEMGASLSIGDFRAGMGSGEGDNPEVGLDDDIDSEILPRAEAKTKRKINQSVDEYEMKPIVTFTQQARDITTTGKKRTRKAPNK